MDGFHRVNTVRLFRRSDGCAGRAEINLKMEGEECDMVCYNHEKIVEYDCQGKVSDQLNFDFSEDCINFCGIEVYEDKLPLDCPSTCAFDDLSNKKEWDITKRVYPCQGKLSCDGNMSDSIILSLDKGLAYVAVLLGLLI